MKTQALLNLFIWLYLSSQVLQSLWHTYY
jgi:hypothetical protein